MKALVMINVVSVINFSLVMTLGLKSTSGSTKKFPLKYKMYIIDVMRKMRLHS